MRDDGDTPGDVRVDEGESKSGDGIVRERDGDYGQRRRKELVV